MNNVVLRSGSLLLYLTAYLSYKSVIRDCRQLQDKNKYLKDTIANKLGTKFINNISRMNIFCFHL
jgi:hypothetical protein